MASPRAARLAPEGEEWRPGRDYDIIGPLGDGEGRMSVVFRIRLRPPRQGEFALKMVIHYVGETAAERAGHAQSTALARGLGAEWREPLTLPPHECLVPVLHHYHSAEPRLRDHIDDPVWAGAAADRTLFLVMPLYTSGSLRSFIAERKAADAVAPYGLGWCWFGQLLLRMLRAAEHLISHDLVHGDIKDDQFFLSDGGDKVVLGDFGTAWKLVDEDGVPAVLASRDELVDRRAGVGRYKAPEVRGRTLANGNPQLRQVYAKAEAFSVGIVMMDILGALSDGDLLDRLCSTHLTEERRFESGQPGSNPADPTYGRKQPGWLYEEADLPPLPAGCPGWLSRVVIGLLKSDHDDAERRLTAAEAIRLLEVEGVAEQWEARQVAEQALATAEQLIETARAEAQAAEQRRAELAQAERERREMRQLAEQERDQARAQVAELQAELRRGGGNPAVELQLRTEVGKLNDLLKIAQADTEEAQSELAKAQLAEKAAMAEGGAAKEEMEKMAEQREQERELAVKAIGELKKMHQKHSETNKQLKSSKIKEKKLEEALKKVHAKVTAAIPDPSAAVPEPEGGSPQLSTIVVSGGNRTYSSVQMYMALDLLSRRADSEGRDWREGIDKASIEAELIKVNQRGYIDETPERVDMDHRGVRFINLTDQPLVCSALDMDGNVIDGGRHDLCAGPYQRTTTAREGDWAPGIMTEPGTVFCLSCGDHRQQDYMVSGDSSQMVLVTLFAAAGGGGGGRGGGRGGGGAAIPMEGLPPARVPPAAARAAEERQVAAEAAERRRAAEAEERRVRAEREAEERRLRAEREAEERRQEEEREAEERRLAAEAEERRRVAELPLRAELQQLTVLELRARAGRDGCTEAAVEDTKLSEQPKVALIGLIVARYRAVTEAAAAEAAAEVEISEARQAWAQKLEDLSSVLTERYQEMEMRALVPEIKANPLVDDAAIEAALTEETPKHRLAHLLAEAAAPGTLLAEAATAANVDAELPVGTRMKVPGQTGIGTYLSFKRARRGGANEHTIAFAGEQAPARVEAISLKEFVWQVDGDKITPSRRWARAHADLDIRGEGGALAKRTQSGGYRTALCGAAMEAEGEHYAEFTLVATVRGCDMVGVARPTYDPARRGADGVYKTADGWMLGCWDGKHCHASTSAKDWASGGPLKVARGETVGLLLSRGRLSVYRNGSAVGVLCEGLSGSFVWAADLYNQGAAVRILRKAVPGA